MIAKERIRCPCCDSIFEIEITEIIHLIGKIILNKLSYEINSILSKEHRELIEKEFNNTLSETSNKESE